MSEVWDRVAARRSAGDAAAWDVLSYGPELPSDAELKLTGDVSGKRVLDLASDFNPRTYGYAKLVDLVAKSGSFEVKRPEGGGVYIRDKA